MLRWIIGSSMRLRFLIIIFAAVLLVAGMMQLRDMPVDVFPEFDPPMVEVQTEALGLSAHEMEAFVTTPVEKDLLNGVAWLDQIYSESVAGLSSILLVFEPGTDPIRARQMVQERLTQSFALPNVSKPPTMLQPLSSTSRVMLVGLSSDEVSLIDMSVLAHWNIEPRLLGVPGVANVSIWGQRDWQLQVQVDPERLNEAGVTLQQIIATTGNSLWVSPLSYLQASSPGSAGWIDTPNQRITLRHVLPISSAEELAQVAIVGADGLVLGDVAQVVEDHQPLIGDAHLNEGPGLLLVIEKFPGANTLEVTRGVEEALEAMRPGLKGIDIDTTVFRQANYIEQAIDNLSAVLPISILLIFLVLGAFYFGWRTALISFVAMLLSLTAAVLILYLRGATFNMLTLAGLIVALGIIVDDAIISVQNVARHLRRQRQVQDGQPLASVIIEASLEMQSPMVFALLIIILVVSPVFLLGGISGAFLRPLVLSYLLAVLASLVVALLVTPALCLTLLSDKPAERRRSAVVEGIQRGYARMLAPLLRAANWVFIAAIVLVLAGLAMIFSFNLSLEHTLKERDLQIHWESAPGTARQEMVRILGRACDELQGIPGVDNCGFHVGRSIKGDQIVTVNSGELWLSLNPNADYDATLQAIREVTDSYPGMVSELQNYRPERLGEVLARPDQDIVVRVYGDNFEVLHSKAQEVSQLISDVDGVINSEVVLPIEEPQLEVEVDLDAAERHRVKPGDVRRAVTTLVSGLSVGNLYEEQRVFDVVVWGVPDIRDSLTDVKEMMIETPDGLVPLKELADIRIAPAPIVIKRDATSRYMDVGVTVHGREFDLVEADIRSRLNDVTFPLEFRAEVFAAYIEWRASQQRVLLAALVAAIGVFFLLQAAFQSWRLAALTFLSLPVALVGSALAGYMGGGLLSLGALFGFLAVLGLAVRNSITLIRHLQDVEQRAGGRLEPEHLLRGAEERLVPILMTALTSGLALVPFVVAGDIPGNEIVRPIAIIILGGLVTSTLLHLFILPTFYWRFSPSLLPLRISRKEVLEPGVEGGIALAEKSESMTSYPGGN